MTDDRNTTDLAALPIEDLVARTERAFVLHHAVPAQDGAEARRTFVEYHALATALNARVRAMVEAIAPAIFDALDHGTPGDLAAVVAEFRAMPAPARRWLFATHMDPSFGVDVYDVYDDIEPHAYTDAAIERRRRLAEADEGGK